MTFTFEEVDAIEATTKTLVADVMDITSLTSCRVDNISVTPELAQFCVEIRKFNRYVKFGINGRAKYALDSKGFRLYKELHVYMDGHTYTMAKIGFGNYSIGSKLSVSKYMMYARTIDNLKFAENKDQRRMATAETLERAIKNVKKYMRPHSLIECAERSFDVMRGKSASVVYGALSESRSAQSAVFESAHLRNELFHMIDVDYEFLAIEFREKIVQWRKKYNENQVTQGRVLHMYYVNVRLHHEETLCDVIEVLDANKHKCVDVNALVTTYKIEDLPEHICGSLAALGMVSNGHYVDGVGLRVASNTFWVQR